MKKIGKLVKEINEELEGAKRYAERYIEYKVDGDSQMANVFREMAQQELQHADNLHSMAVTVIDKIRAVYTPSMEMQEKWDEMHEKYKGCAAEVKRMLSM